MKRTTCALCGSKELVTIIDLGLHPLADTFLKSEQLSKPEEKYPLKVALCKNCGHAQSEIDVPPQKRYQENEYSYDSGNSKVSISHFQEMAKEVSDRLKLNKDDLVVDIGSNVGTLLSAFRNYSGAKVFGVEPALNMANKAEANGIPTVNDFWNKNSANKALAIQKPKAITITNAFNHISDLDDFMREVTQVLDEDGLFVIEAPYFLHLLEKDAFDTIYLEHVSYFAVKPLKDFFHKFKLNIVDLSENDYMGGSFRLYIGRQGESAKVAEYIERENKAQLFSPETYEEFMKRIEIFKKDLLLKLQNTKDNGGRIVGIGAATKGNTLLNYVGIDTKLLDFVTDSSPYKIGKFTPGSRIPIRPDEDLDQSITHALILPWNIADMLKEKLGSRLPHLQFIVPRMNKKYD